MTELVCPPRVHQGERHRPVEYRLSGYNAQFTEWQFHLRNLHLALYTHSAVTSNSFLTLAIDTGI